MMDIEINNDDFLQIEPIAETMSNSTSIIKVMGVGGGGGNAVKHMYNMGITGVDFMISNTDKQALQNSPIPIKIQLGDGGLGAGADPDVARQAALESTEEIKRTLEGTKMLFITAGMGGGTGTGASPIVAEVAREMGILTIAIVTYPFSFEQKGKFEIADDGVKELRQNVDALIVIKNESIKKFYPDLKISNAFAKVDDVLLIAAKSIAELITVHGIMNVDFNDVKAVLKDSGTAIIGSGMASGKDRAILAVEAATNSPLLEQNSIHGAEKMLLFISYGANNELGVEELGEITEFLENKTCSEKKTLIWGHGIDETLDEGDYVRVTVIVTGLEGSNAKLLKKEEKQPEEEKPPTKENEPTPEDLIKIRIEQIKTQKDIDNSALRNMSGEEMNEYYSVPAYRRDCLNDSNTSSQCEKENECEDEISTFRIGTDGVDENPSFLTKAVD